MGKEQTPPVTPPETPPTQPAEAFDPTAPPVPQVFNPEHDPDHLIKQMISNRPKKKTEEPKDKKEEKKPEEPAAKAGDKTEEISKSVGGAIANALGFRKPKEEKAKPEEPAAKEEVVKAEEEPPKKKESIVKEKKPAKPDLDPVQIATAAATAAVKAVQPPAPRPEKKVDIAETLKDADRHEYEVARYLGSIDPKYKDAEKVILNQVRKVDSYAEAWQKQNPGKAFDPDDEEHNEFYAKLEEDKPWSDYEFQNAAMEMAAERVQSRTRKSTDAKLDEIQQNNARLELNPVIERTFITSAGLIAKGVEEGLLEKIQSKGLEEFAKEDPLTADILAATIGPLQPLIETIIQVDDPKGRFPLDDKNQNHVQWYQFLTEKEEQFMGTKDDQGRRFATRSDYAAMSPAQRKGYFYLTADHLVSELVTDAAAMAKERIEAEKKKIEAAAERMGYVKNGKPAKPPASKKAEPETPPEDHEDDEKPASPSAGAGVKIDNPGAGAKAGRDGVLSATHSILFGR